MTYLFKRYDYSLFESRFRDYNRLDQFPKGLRDLFNYLESLAEDCGEPIEVDVVALCCEYAEIDIKDIPKQTGYADIHELRESTTVIVVDDDTIICGVY